MEWALGLTPDLGFPNKTCDVSKAVELLKDCHSIEDILKISNPRSKKELLDACDLIFVWTGRAPMPESTNFLCLRTWTEAL